MDKPISPAKSDVTMTLRVNKAQLAAIKEQAAKNGLSQSYYLTHLVEQDIKKNEQQNIME